MCFLTVSVTEAKNVKVRDISDLRSMCGNGSDEIAGR